MYPRGLIPATDPSSPSGASHSFDTPQRPRRPSFQELASGPFAPPFPLASDCADTDVMSVAAALRALASDTANVFVILASLYALPCCLWKLATYVAEHKRRRYPCESLQSAVSHWVLGTRPDPPSGPSPLDRLPVEVLMHICARLPAEAVVNLGLTCHRMHRLTHLDALWLVMLRRDFRTRMERVFPKSRSGGAARHRRQVLGVGTGGAPVDEGVSMAPPSPDVSMDPEPSKVEAVNPAPRKRLMSMSKNRRWQYRVLAETAAVCSPCQCPPAASTPSSTSSTSRTAANGAGTCYACLARSRNSSFWAAHRATWRDLSLPPRSLLALLATHARSKLHHVPLTPLKLLGVLTSLPLLALSHLRLSRMVHHGLFGHVARDLHASTVAILTESVVEDGHWLLVTAPLAVAAIGMRDLDVAVTKLVARADVVMALGKSMVVGSALGMVVVAGYVVWQVVAGGRSLYSF
ncbi:hypothetical protein BCR44DRAFT_1251698 [Catenaria anguillulae PL171]|uniref:F-box domain-containing protein n=1 Tax=Catenaria anguillulae PL171 TaxID=765915 RepID=A0A1Y2I090_9FUNG|nr:hypothetical protein BCR44DRAFT_1251698 [Catenaria anguillulae PL171]